MVIDAVDVPDTVTSPLLTTCPAPVEVKEPEISATAPSSIVRLEEPEISNADPVSETKPPPIETL